MSSVEEYEGSLGFQALVVAAEGKPERSMGDSVIPAEPPQWADVRNKANELLGTAPAHLAVLVHLVKAETNLKGFAGLHQSLATIREHLGQAWDSIYPPEDADDPDDPHYARVNLLRELSDDPAFTDTVYRLPLIDVRGIGAYSARDIDIARGSVNGTDDEQQRCQDGLIKGAFQETDVAALQTTMDALSETVSLCTELEGLFADKAGSYNALSLDKLNLKLSECLGIFKDYAGDSLQPTAPEAVEESHNDDGARTAPAGKRSQLNSRTAVMRSFAAIIAYYQQYEPSSPVGILAQRARDMVTKPFFDVLQELAPAEKDNFAAVLGSLENNPTAFLINDSYRRFLAGESMPAAVAESVAHSNVVAAASGEAPDDDVIAAPDDTQVTAGAGMAELVVIQSRAEVLSTLSELELFFLEHEPSSPIPLILADMRKLVAKNFTELLAEFRRSLPSDTERLAGQRE